MREKPLQVREILDGLPESWFEMDGLPEFYIARIYATLDKGLLWDQPLLHSRTPMKLTVCNYSLVRFMPYPDTEEFINLGVVLHCPEIMFFGFKIGTSKTQRVTHFLPEFKEVLEPFRVGRKAIRNELERVKQILHDPRWKAGQAVLEPLVGREAFIGLIHTREGLFHFSPARSVMATDPNQELEKLFGHYVERSFAEKREQVEAHMTNQLRLTLQERKLTGHFEARVFENEFVRVRLTFVQTRQRGVLDSETSLVAREPDAQRPKGGIRPLNLDLKDTQRIVEKVDAWQKRLSRWQDIKDRPEQVLLVSRLPASGKKRDFANEVLTELDEIPGLLVAQEETPIVVKFAEHFFT